MLVDASISHIVFGWMVFFLFFCFLHVRAIDSAVSALWLGTKDMLFLSRLIAREETICLLRNT